MSINHHPPNIRKSIRNATRRVALSSLVQIGDWILEQDENGNLSAHHQNTQNKVIIAAPHPTVSVSVSVTFSEAPIDLEATPNG